MQAIFILIRLPFYCIGIAILTVFGVVLGLPISFFWVVILPPLWVIFAVPFMLVISALSNDVKEFNDFLHNSVTRWWKEIVEGPVDFLDNYAGMTKWLFGVKKESRLEES